MTRKKFNKEDKLNLESIMANVIKHNEKSEENIFIKDLRTIVSAARDTSYRMANIMQVLQNWLIGRRIVVQEQQGRARADYGKHIIELASLSLSEAFGRGLHQFSRQCLLNLLLMVSCCLSNYLGVTMKG